jgi:hypothetical protein
MEVGKLFAKHFSLLHFLAKLGKTVLPRLGGAKRRKKGLGGARRGLKCYSVFRRITTLHSAKSCFHVFPQDGATCQ